MMNAERIEWLRAIIKREQQHLPKGGEIVWCAWLRDALDALEIERGVYRTPKVKHQKCNQCGRRHGLDPKGLFQCNYSAAKTHAKHCYEWSGFKEDSICHCGFPLDKIHILAIWNYGGNWWVENRVGFRICWLTKSATKIYRFRGIRCQEEP